MNYRGRQTAPTPARWIGALLGLLAGSLVGMLLGATAGNAPLWLAALAGGGLFLGMMLGRLLDNGL